MAKFEVLKTDKVKTLTKIRMVKDEDGNKVAEQYEENIVMKVGAYGHRDINEGDVIELEGHLADKARRNTEYFREVKEVKEVKDDAPKARRGRPPKNAP